MNRRTALPLVMLSVLLVAGCAPQPGPSPERSETPTASDPPIETATPTPTPTATPASIPDDCREILTDAVLAELGETPLNDPAFGPSGVQDDGSLICTWGDPRADTTGLSTTISQMNRGPALDLRGELADDEDYSCFTPDGGTRCEKTWQNETYPVTDGRTLFWRDDILIDTRYSNLAPSGYTSAIITSIWDD
ncbi:MAG: DUF3558 family protein [Mobilicoccus sp.]|nr:DUF3558 family protein [Mobilicoccus sp.]